MNKRIVIVVCLAICLVFTMAACGGKKSSGVVDIKSPADFPGHNIAVQVDTTAADAMDEIIEGGVKGIEVSKYEKVTQCFDDLSLGRVDAVYVDSVVAAYYTTGNDKYKITWINDEGEPLGMCMAKGNDSLAAAIEACLDTMFFDGTMAGIAKSHFGEDFTAGVRSPSAAPAIPMNFATKKEGVLMVGSEIGYPPMEYKADNGIDNIGFDIDVAYRIGELLGLNIEFVDTAWDGIFFGVEKGEYDIIISSVSITEERQAKYLLTNPYVSNALCIVVRAE